MYAKHVTHTFVNHCYVYDLWHL